MKRELKPELDTAKLWIFSSALSSVSANRFRYCDVDETGNKKLQFADVVENKGNVIHVTSYFEFQ